MLYYDTLLHDPDALAFLIRAVGIDRIMLGSDMPFPIGDPSPLAVLDGLDMARPQQAGQWRCQPAIWALIRCDPIR